MADAVAAPKPVRDRRIGIVFLTIFLDLVGFSIIFPLFPAMLDYYLPDGGGEGSLLGRMIAPLTAFAERAGAEDPRFMTAVLFGGILGSLYSILQFIFAPIWGAISDRTGRRPILLLTVAGIALSYLLWIFAASFWVLILSRILAGVMGGNLSVATAAVADVTSRENRTKGLAVVGIAFGLGFLVGPAIGGLSSLINLTELAPVLTNYGINPFSVPAMISFVLALVNLLWIHRRFKETLSVSASAAAKKAVQPKAGLAERFGVFRLLRLPSPELKRTNLVYLLYMIAFSGMEFTLTFLAVERFAFSPAQNGLMFVFIGFVLIVVQGGLVRRLSGPVGEKRLAVTGLACGIVALLLLGSANQLSLFFIGLAIMASSVALCSPTLSALVSLYSSEQTQGESLGVFRSAGALARAIGPLIAAFIFFRYGSTFAYTLGALMIVIPLVLALALRQPEKRD